MAKITMSISNHQVSYTAPLTAGVPKSFSMKVATAIDAANAKLSDIQFAIDEKIAEQNLSTDGLSAQTQ